MSQRDDVIAGRYRLLDRIGSGGMGQVWRAHDERLGREVAVKQLHTQRGVGEDEAEVWNQRAMREARITARLHHEHAVPVFDVVEHAGQPCLIMQYFPSRSLAEILTDRGRLPVPVVARIGSEVAAALAAAHTVGIVHRDVKPANVLIADDGTAKITDFGIAHAMGDVSLTSTGMVTGTPAYLAPEVAKGVRATPASDVFSLGSTLYAALEGQPPFGTGDNPIAVLHQVASGDVVPPQQAGPLTPLLLRMLAREAEDRPLMADVAGFLAAPVEDGSGPADSTLLMPHRTDAVEQPTPDEPATPVDPTPAAGGAVGAAAAAGVAGAAGMAEAAPRDGGAPPGDLGVDAVAPPEDPVPPTTPPQEPSGLDALWAPREEGDAPDDRQGDPRRRRAGFAVLAVGAVVLALLLGVQLFGGEPPSVAGPDDTGSGQGTPTTSASTSPSPSPTASPTKASPTPSATPTPTPTPKPTPKPPPATSAAPVSGTPTAAQLSRAVRDYYALLPGDTDAGYALLTENYRDAEAGSKARYTGFWNTIASVEVSDVSATAPSTVTARLRYVDDDGDVHRERRSYRLVEDDGVLKIDDSRIIG